MKHLGDITKISGYAVPPVDVLTGGSPCQDLSVAGKRAGLEGERSGLFMEQIRIVKEMRENDKANGRSDELIRPRYMVWENVAGAFSSNKGEDFRVVLEEIAKIKDKDAVIPGPPNGKWAYAGCIMGDGYSICWTLHDAQYWGVPQRRKRICVLADFNGDTAPRILFELRRKTADSETHQTITDIGTEPGCEIQSECKSLSRDTEESGKEGQGVTTDVERGIRETSRAISFQERAGKPGGGKGILIQDERTGALSTLNNQSVCAFEPGAASRVGGHVYEDGVAGSLRANAGDNQQAIVYGISSYDSNAMKSNNPHSGVYEADTTRTLDLNGGNPGCNQGGMAVVMKSCAWDGSQISPTLTANNANGAQRMEELSGPQVARGPGAVCAAVDCRNGTENPEVNGTLQSKEQGYNTNSNNICRIGSVVRRLTPLECERLQGFPDGWTDIGDWVDSKGKKHKGESDSPRYKALGNSIALPYWAVLAEKIRPYLGSNPTMASLFDGIGGFPLVFSRVGVTPIWASEIEEFPMAVTKLRFPEKKHHVRRNKNVQM